MKKSPAARWGSFRFDGLSSPQGAGAGVAGALSGGEAGLASGAGVAGAVSGFVSTASRALS